MEEFIAKMSAKVGIDKATAERVMGFLKDNAGEAMQALQKSGIKLPSGVGEKLGGML